MISVVEFWGLMGSGKTTLATLVEARLGQRGLHTHRYPAIDDWITRSGEVLDPAARKPPRLSDNLPSVIAGLQALYLGATSKPRRTACVVHARRLAGWHRQTDYLRQLPTDHVAIQDEGVIHMIMPLVLFGVDYDPGPLDRLARTLASDDHKLFVFVRSDRETALQRIRQRSGLGPGQPSRIWRFEQASPQQEEEIMQQMETLFERIDRAIAAVASKRTLVVSNDSDPDATADTIASFIEKSLAG